MACRNGSSCSCTLRCWFSHAVRCPSHTPRYGVPIPHPPLPSAPTRLPVRSDLSHHGGHRRQHRRRCGGPRHRHRRNRPLRCHHLPLTSQSRRRPSPAAPRHHRPGPCFPASPAETPSARPHPRPSAATPPQARALLPAATMPRPSPPMSGSPAPLSPRRRRRHHRTIDTVTFADICRLVAALPRRCRGDATASPSPPATPRSPRSPPLGSRRSHSPWRPPPPPPPTVFPLGPHQCPSPPSPAAGRTKPGVWGSAGDRCSTHIFFLLPASQICFCHTFFLKPKFDHRSSTGVRESVSRIRWDRSRDPKPPEGAGFTHHSHPRDTKGGEQRPG